MITRTTRSTKTPAFRDTLRRPMISHISDSHQIPSQKKTNSKLQILKKLLKMDRTKTVGATERTRDAGRTDGRTDRRTDRVKQLRCAGGIIMITMIMMIIMITIIIITTIMMIMIIRITAMIMIIVITTTLTMTIMQILMIKTVQTPSQSLYKDRRI